MEFVVGAGDPSLATQKPTMTVSFKMDITTSGTHNGLFITTGIQNGSNAQMKQFGFVQPNTNQLTTSTAPQLAIASAASTPIPCLAQTSGKETQIETVPRTSLPSTLNTNISNDFESLVVSPLPQRHPTTVHLADINSVETTVNQKTNELKDDYNGQVSSRSSAAQQTQQMDCPSSLANHTADEFLKNVPFKINTFAEESWPFVQHPTNLVLNDTTTTTTTVEVFRANLDNPSVEYYKLPMPPAGVKGQSQLISARGPPYEVHTSTETSFADTPTICTPMNLPTTKSVQWDTREPIKILQSEESARSDSRYGSHGSIDTILRKQWIENKTETITRRTSPSLNQANEDCQRDSFHGSNRSLIDHSRESSSFALLDNQNESKKLGACYVTQPESTYHERSVLSQDPRLRYREKRLRSTQNSESPVRHEQQQKARPKATNFSAETLKTMGKSAIRHESGRPRQSWEYTSSKQQPKHQMHTYKRQQQLKQPASYFHNDHEKQHSHTNSGVPSQMPSLQATKDYVERPPYKTCESFATKQQHLSTQLAPQRCSKTPPPATMATEYGKPTLVYTPYSSQNQSFVEDDYYGKLREEQYRRSRPRQRDIRDRSRSPSPWEWERPESPNYRMGNRSASSNENFRLYQTRDCLGNVLYELDRELQPSKSQQAQPQFRSSRLSSRQERPVSQHSYQTQSNRSSRNLEDAKFDEYNNVRLVVDGAKLHIVQEGKV